MQPSTASAPSWSQRLMLGIILFGVCGAGLTYSLRTAAPTIDFKWLVIGLATALLLVFYGWNWQKSERQIGSLPALVGLGAMAVGIIVAAMFADQRAAAVYALPFFLAPLAWATMTLTVRWTVGHLLIFQRGLIVLGALVAAIGVLQYYAPGAVSELLGYGSAASKGRSAILSTIGNPEYLGGFLAPLALLALAALWREMKRSASAFIGYGLAFMVMFWALLLTEARGAWIGFAAGFVILAVCLWAGRFLQPEENEPEKPVTRDTRRGTKVAGRQVPPQKETKVSKPINRKWVGIISGAAVLLLLLVILPTPLNPYRVDLLKRVAQSADLGSAAVQQRLLIYVVTADMIRTDGWIGLGPNAFAPQFALRLNEMQNRETEGSILKIAWRLGNFHPGFVHSEPLQFWVESGILGVGGFLLIVAASMGMFWGTVAGIWQSRLNEAGDVKVGAISFSVFAGFASAWFCGLTASLLSFPFHVPDRVILYWTLFALMGAAAARVKSSRP